MIHSPEYRGVQDGHVEAAPEASCRALAPAQARTDVARGHRLAADGAAHQPDDDHRRADVRRADAAGAAEEGDPAAVPRRTPASGRSPSTARPARSGWRTSTSTSTGMCAWRGCRDARGGRPRSARWSVSSASWRRARWIRPSRCGSSTWSSAIRAASARGGAHPPLLCRRHRAGAGAAVADRHQPRIVFGFAARQSLVEGAGGAGGAPRRRDGALHEARRQGARAGHGDDAGPVAGRAAGEGGRRHRPRAGARAGAAGRPAVAPARATRRQQARGLGRAAGPGGSEGGGPRLRLHRQRRADGRRRRRAARLHARARRRRWRA